MVRSSNNADYNTANGNTSFLSNTTGTYNTATGFIALHNNTVGNYNTADGLNALVHNTTGDANTANGVSALFNNTTGSTNTAIGILALENSTTGDSNIALGFKPGPTSPPAATISISATSVLLASPTTFASAQQEHRRTPLLPVSREQPLQVQRCRKRQWSTRRRSFLGPVQGSDQTDG